MPEVQRGSLFSRPIDPGIASCVCFAIGFLGDTYGCSGWCEGMGEGQFPAPWPIYAPALVSCLIGGPILHVFGLVFGLMGMNRRGKTGTWAMRGVILNSIVFAPILLYLLALFF